MGEKPKLVVSFWQSCGHQQNQHEKTFGVATVLTGYFGNLMATITTDMNISREHSKFLWITSAIFRSPAKLVRKDAWNSQNSYKLFWKSCGYHHNRYENQPGTFKVLMAYIGNLQVTSKIGTEKTPGTTKILIGYFGNLMVGGTTDMKISLQQTARCTEIA